MGSRRRWEFAHVVVLSQYVAASYLDSLLEHGGFGYLLKERIADVAELNRTLGEVIGGGIAVDPEMISSLLQSRCSGIANLTPRETEVVELMARGLSNNASPKSPTSTCQRKNGSRSNTPTAVGPLRRRGNGRPWRGG